MLVYLAGPIDMAAGENHFRAMADVMKDFGISCYNPRAAYAGLNTQDKTDVARMITVNKLALYNSSAVVMMMRHDVPSVGTPIELYMAHQNHTPILAIWTGTPTATPAYLSHYADIVYGSLDELILDNPLLTIQKLTVKKSHLSIYG